MIFFFNSFLKLRSKFPCDILKCRFPLYIFPARFNFCFKMPIPSFWAYFFEDFRDEV